MASCLLLSATQGPWALFASGTLTLVEVIHDDLGFSGHLVFKNLCNVGGYTTFELGASICMSMGP